MADEQATAPDAGLASTPATAIPQNVQQEPPAQAADVPETIPDPGELAGEQDGDTQSDETAAEEEFATIEIEGVTYQVPKALEKAFLQEADYTKKSQATAARGRDLDQREATLKQQAEATDVELRDRASLLDIDEKLAKYKDVDWVTWAQQDPGAAQEHRFYVDRLLQQRQGAATRVSEAQTQRSQAAQRDFAKRAEDTLQFARKIQGWTPEIDAQVEEFAKSVLKQHGFDDAATQKFIATNLSPATYDFMYKAWIGSQVLSKPAAAQTRPATPIAPLQVVKGNAATAVKKSPADYAKADDMEGYVRARKAQDAR